MSQGTTLLAGLDVHGLTPATRPQEPRSRPGEVLGKELALLPIKFVCRQKALFLQPGELGEFVGN